MNKIAWTLASAHESQHFLTAKKVCPWKNMAPTLKVAMGQRAPDRASFPWFWAHLQDLVKSLSLSGFHLLILKWEHETWGPFWSWVFSCGPVSGRGRQDNVYEKNIMTKHRKSAHKPKSENKSEKWAAYNQGRLNWGDVDPSHYF